MHTYDQWIIESFWVLDIVLVALYSHFSWSLQQLFNEYYSYLHFWNEQAGFRESCQLSQSWQVVNWYSNHMFAKWKRNNRWMEAAANVISFSACRSWLQRWTTLVWCPQWVKIFHSRGGLLDTSGRRHPKESHSVGVGSDSCILLCLLHNQKWRRTTVYKLPWYAWYVCPGAMKPPASLFPWTPWEGQGGADAATLQERLGLESVLCDRRVHWARPCAGGQGKAAYIWCWCVYMCSLSV